MDHRPHPAGWTASGILPGEQLEPDELLFGGGNLIRHLAIARCGCGPAAETGRTGPWKTIM